MTDKKFTTRQRKTELAIHRLRIEHKADWISSPSYVDGRHFVLILESERSVNEGGRFSHPDYPYGRVIEAHYREPTKSHLDDTQERYVLTYEEFLQMDRPLRIIKKTTDEISRK